MLECNKHDPVCIKRGIYKTLLSDFCLSVKEHWYKLIAEALRVLAEVPRFFLKGYDGTEDETTKKEEMDHVASSIFESIEPLLSATDVDQEIKECALSTCASLLSALHSNLSKEQMNKLLTLILDRLQNETTRIASIKTLSTVASAFDSDSMDDDNKIDLSLILGDSITAMASFLKQQSRSLKQSSLEALDTIITYHGSEDPSLDDGKLFSTVLAEVADLIADSDLHISDLSLYVYTCFQHSWPNYLR
jgi:cullin-associated NEDD8-dissociated protein 1